MNIDKRALVPVRGWLAVYLVTVYVHMMMSLASVGNAIGGLSDPLAVGPLHNDVLALLITYVVLAIVLVVAAWAIHGRYEKSRLLLLGVIPLIILLLSVQHWMYSSIIIRTSGQEKGRFLTLLTSSQHLTPIPFLVVQGAWWLYWLRSTRVKRTFQRDLNQIEGAVVRIQGWLSLYVIGLYIGLVSDFVFVTNVVRSLSDPVATDHVRTELLVLLVLLIPSFIMMRAIAAWMIHQRHPQTRMTILILNPIGLLMALLYDHSLYALSMMVAAFNTGKALAAVAHEHSMQYWVISVSIAVLLRLAAWLYWLRSERVKVTFA